MKIAIVMPTYYKEDTFDLITKTIDSLKKQTHKDWHLFLIGDKYEMKQEFRNIANTLKDKCTSINLPIAKEREKYIDNKTALWNTGGVNANNVGIELALLCGYNYIAHLDHDDLWESNHLEEINKCIELTGSVFICTKSTYKEDEILPNIKSNDLYINYLPSMGKQIHSSICVDFSRIKTRYIDYYEKTNIPFPSDGMLANDIRDELKEKGYLSTCINQLTVNHDIEGSILER